MTVVPKSLTITAADDAKVYERLKEDLCSKYPDDRNSYVDGKKELVAELLAKAKRWREGQ